MDWELLFKAWILGLVATLLLLVVGSVVSVFGFALNLASIFLGLNPSVTWLLLMTLTFGLFPLLFGLIVYGLAGLLFEEE